MLKSPYVVSTRDDSSAKTLVSHFHIGWVYNNLNIKQMLFLTDDLFYNNNIFGDNNHWPLEGYVLVFNKDKTLNMSLTFYMILYDEECYADNVYRKFVNVIENNPEFEAHLLIAKNDKPFIIDFILWNWKMIHRKDLADDYGRSDEICYPGVKNRKYEIMSKDNPMVEVILSSGWYEIRKQVEDKYYFIYNDRRIFGDKMHPIHFIDLKDLDLTKLDFPHDPKWYLTKPHDALIKWKFNPKALINGPPADGGQDDTPVLYVELLRDYVNNVKILQDSDIIKKAEFLSYGVIRYIYTYVKC